MKKYFKINKYIIILFLTAILDTFSTVAVLHYGGFEGNPIMNFLIHFSLPMFILIRAIVIPYVIMRVSIVFGENHKYFLGIISIIWFIAFINNYLNYLKLTGL